MEDRTAVYDQLFSAQEVYRPPLERHSALLEVTSGCSYGKCTFCDFTRDSFSVFSMEQIRRKIQLLSQVIDGNDQLHFLGCNPLCLPTKMLLDILELVRRYLPSVRQITMYARAEDVLKKTPEEMWLLRQNGITQLHIGVESGCPQLLELHNKGETPEELLKALEILTQCGIGYHLTVILGLGGAAFSGRHAAQTAAFLSQTRPLSIWCMALKVWPGTPLADMVKEGRFVPMTPEEILREERELVQRLVLPHPCIYVDSTALGQYTLLAALPQQKQGLLDKIDFLLGQDQNN